ALVVARSTLPIRDAWRHSTDTDFGPFYAAGGLMLTGDRTKLYSQPMDVPARYQRAPHNYFNPPGFALLYSPFTAVDITLAHKILTALTLVATAALAWLCSKWTAGRLGAVLIVLAIFSFWPVYETMRLGHVSVFYAICGVAAI